MGTGFLSQILLLIVFLPATILLIYVSLKFGGKQMNNLSNGKLIRVVERIQLSQNAFLAIVVINNKPYVVSSSNEGVQILKELDESVMESINAKKSLDFKTIPGFDKILNLKNRRNMDNEKIQ